ncbi:MAG: iron-containing alcohol dehydrogenase family protein [Alphaproteobacteria bacterium]|nr:iron-containing alcohol dehydrogenase family protein [Alphaproteobacteria bacterium]
MFYAPYPNKQINIPYLLKIGSGKVKKIGKYLADKNLFNAAVFWSEGIQHLLSERFYPGMEENKVKIVYEQDVRFINIEEITKITFNLPKTTDVIIGIGGGKALDFAKFCAHLLRLPFISVPTSTSNDGFCSPNSSLIVDGKRKTVKASIPFGVVADLDVIKESPQICLYSGVGDMVSKITALYDWKQAAERGLDRYNDFASLMSYNSLTLLFNKHSTNINETSFQRSLVNSLLTSGIAMEIAGSSRPASGSEHLISHGLDAVSRRPRMHGLQVGVATYLCALLQNNPSTSYVRDILSVTGFFNYIKQDPLSKDDFIKALQMAPTIKANYYTVLSEPDSFARALQIIDKDTILNQIIRY